MWKMDPNEIMFSRGGNSNGEGFIDRSKVRILLCDNDVNSSDEVFTLLCKCSYQGINLICFILFDLFVFN